MTEKNYNPEQKNQKLINKQQKVQKMQSVQQPANKQEAAKQEKKTEEMKKEEIKQELKEAKEEQKAPENKSAVKEKPKKTKAVVNGIGIPISTKQSMAICMFIKRKKIEDAIKNLEQVSKLKKPIPMKGEIPHRKGEIMSGRFPQKAAKEFIIMLKSLAANSVYNGLENPVITQAYANIGSRPFGRRGRRKKRTNITIIAEAIAEKVKEEKKK